MGLFGKRAAKRAAEVGGAEALPAVAARNDASEPSGPAADVLESPAERPGAATGGTDGPFDIEDFDDATSAEVARLDLGSVLIPLPGAAQLQVELTESGVPSAVWLVTPNGRFTIAAYAAPKTGGLWREVAAELAESLRTDSAEVVITDGPWGREVAGNASGAIHFIGVDGYRWMIRCVVNGPHETIGALIEEARAALADTVVRRGDTPLPVRTPLAVQLPEALVEQLRAAAEQHEQMVAAEAEQAADGPTAARRGADGSAMQQLRGTTAG